MKIFGLVVHSIAEDGLPDMDDHIGEVAFIFDGCIVSGWPLPNTNSNGAPLWEADSDVGNHRLFGGVTHWVQLPPIKDLTRGE